MPVVMRKPVLEAVPRSTLMFHSPLREWCLDRPCFLVSGVLSCLSAAARCRAFQLASSGSPHAIMCTAPGSAQSLPAGYIGVQYWRSDGREGAALFKWQAIFTPHL